MQNKIKEFCKIYGGVNSAPIVNIKQTKHAWPCRDP